MISPTIGTNANSSIVLFNPKLANIIGKINVPNILPNLLTDSTKPVPLPRRIVGYERAAIALP